MCDRPLHGFQIGYTRKGKPNYLICSPQIDYIYKDKDKWIKAHGTIPRNLKRDYISRYTLIPCGSCLSCRITRAAEMADRAMLEMNYHDKACFITLTYDDEHIIRSNYINRTTGESGISETLFKKHYQDFIKRLRKHYNGVDIRYVLCGEYGETTLRPHYHAIIFGVFPDDAIPFSVNKRGQQLYTSDIMCKLWRKGYVVIGECTRDSANYVCRYVTKKLYSDIGKDLYQDRGRIPPFIVSSKRPAIGKRWYDDNKEWCMDSTISYSTPDGGHTFKAPRYFNKLYESELENVDIKDALEYYRIRDLREEIAYLQDEHLSERTDADIDDIAAAKERSSQNKAAGFKRDMI